MQLLGTKRIRTTAYHPIANGLIERFHRQLKTALKCQSIPSNWVSALPLILLGIRTSLKGDLRCSAAELVYGTTLRLPGQFFDTPKNESTSDPAGYLTKLRDSMQQLRATPTRLPKQRRVYVDQSLSSCTHIFVRHDAVRSPLSHPTMDHTKSYNAMGSPIPFGSMVRTVLYHWTASSQLIVSQESSAKSNFQ